MNIFYIPDGPRRYADRIGCSLTEAYRLGYHVLVEEVVDPLLALTEVEALDVFLLSTSISAVETIMTSSFSAVRARRYCGSSSTIAATSRWSGPWAPIWSATSS